MHASMYHGISMSINEDDYKLEVKIVDEQADSYAKKWSCDVLIVSPGES